MIPGLLVVALLVVIASAVGRARDTELNPLGSIPVPPPVPDGGAPFVVGPLQPADPLAPTRLVPIVPRDPATEPLRPTELVPGQIRRPLQWIGGDAPLEIMEPYDFDEEGD